MGTYNRPHIEDEKSKNIQVNVIDTVGFCDTVFSPAEVLTIIKSSVSVNVATLDRVVFVCSGRIESVHVDSMKQLLGWLKYNNNKICFSFIYNKSENSSDMQKTQNLEIMCNILGVDGTTSIIFKHGDGTRHNVKLNQALGFPPNGSLSDMEEDLRMLKILSLNAQKKNRLKIDESWCTIL